MEKIFGNINSFENCSTNHGPGIRFVVNLQGCPVRCLYCKDVETWSTTINQKLTSEEILEKYDKIKSSLSQGGLSVSGGEALLQLDFVIDLFKKAKEKNIHTTLLTSGLLYNPKENEKYLELVKYCDLFIVDIKHIDPIEHKKLTQKPIENLVGFLKFLENNKKDYWLRHIIIPNVTSLEKYLKDLGHALASLNHLKALDILPFFEVDQTKYEKLNIPCVFKGVHSTTLEQLKYSRQIVFEALKEAKEILLKKNLKN